MRIALAIFLLAFISHAKCGTATLSAAAKLELAKGSISLPAGAVVDVLGDDGQFATIVFRTLKGRVPHSVLRLEANLSADATSAESVGALLPQTSGTVDPHVAIAAVPDWVMQDEQPDYQAPLPEKTEVGYDNLLIDDQEDVEHEASYSRVAFRITSNAALQNAAQVSVGYDPAYQRIEFHFVRVIRDSHVSDRLTLKDIRMFEQERDLDRLQLNGEMTALLVLDDIRVGDIIDYAYTCHGRNPILGGHFRHYCGVRWWAPIRRERIRVLVDNGHKLLWKEQGTPILTVATRVVGAQKEYLWTASNVAPVEVDPQLPVWFNPFTFLQISDFSDWRAVVSWARPLYAIPEPIPGNVCNKTDELIRGLSTQEQRALAILHFVQQEIRYLGIQLGPHSHRPSPPEQVLERRYGDCKDKTLLLCAMLKHAGIEAVPALTHDTRRQTMRDWLPSTDVFDHAIAVIRMDRGEFWVDPTLTDQVGAFAWRGLPNYQFALRIDDSAVDLAEVVLPPNARSTKKSSEVYSVADIKQPASYEITTVYHGAAADEMRSTRRQVSSAQLAKYFLNFRARIYPKLTSQHPPVWTDDEDTNTLTCAEHYSVPDLWQKSEGKSVWTAEFYPLILRDYLVAPKSLNRSMPIALAYPADITYEALVNLPVAFLVKPTRRTVQCDGFSGSSSVASAGKKVTLQYCYRSLADHVPVGRVASYADALKSLRDNLGYTLQYDPTYSPPLSGFSPNWGLFAIALVTSVTALLGSWWCYRWQTSQPHPTPYDAQALAGLGGWLVLVGFGVVIRPIVMTVNFFRMFTKYFNERIWRYVTDPGTPGYHSGRGIVITAELIANLGLIITGFFIVVLFFRKKQLFPKAFVTWLAAMVVVQIADSAATAVFLKHTVSNGTQTGALVFAACIWIPYMFCSRRVQATFLQ